MKILFTGGGTGGHIMPLIAVGRELKKQMFEVELNYIGPKNDCLIMSKENFKTYAIVSGKIRRYFSFLNIIDLLFKIPFGFLQSFFLLLFIKPKIVFSKGGTGSLPTTYCARILKIPVFIHESDSVPGTSNKITSAWAKKIFTSFENTEYFNKDKVIVSGNPIRKDLLLGNKEEAKKELNLASEKPVILISGGSLGSQAINDFILLVLNNFVNNYEIIHIAGTNNYKRMVIESKAFLPDELEKHYHLYEFLNEVQLKNSYAAADIVISRAGASSIFEIAATGKPSILIPLPSSANNHQSKNAYQYVKSGACVVMEQENLSPNFFLGEIDNMLSVTEKMSEAALRFAKPEAAEMIAKSIINYIM